MLETGEDLRWAGGEPAGGWNLEARLAIPGVSLELCAGVWDKPLDVTRCHPSHILSLALSPLADMRDCYMPNPHGAHHYAVGKVSLRPANVPCRIVHSGGRQRWFRVLLDPSHVDALIGTTDTWDFSACADIQGTGMANILLRLAQETASPGFASEILAEGLSNALIVELARFCRRTKNDAKEDGALSQRQVRRIRDYLEDFEGSPPTVAELAQLVGVSRRHLTRLFKRSTGQTIHEFATEVRVQKGIRRMCSTDLSAKEISRRLGFAAPWGFSVAFRNAMGQTPTSFRRQLNGPRLGPAQTE